jgi:two-component system response regulator HydG
MRKILVVDDDIDICLLLSRFLTKKDFEVATTHSGKKALEMLKATAFDLVLCDFRLGDMDGLEVLKKAKELNPEIKIVIITGYSDIKIAVNAIKLGAYDYVIKPLIPDEILLSIQKALDAKPGTQAMPFHDVAATNASAKPAAPFVPEYSDNFIIGESEESKELYRQIDLVAPTNYSVIIYGESGTGKESVAQSIHNRSQRKNKPFVAMDCGVLSKELAGSELFGHEKGSFTGALNSKIGHFELANGGTLFLDEIYNLSYEIQVSLLRVVQERKVKRIGGTKEIDLDVRIIVATNENLYEACRKGNFREDLYHRFNEFSVNMEPLRNRNKDIMIFAKHFLGVSNRELGKNIKGFSDDVINSFMTYQWPGNLREQKNVIKRAALLTDGDWIQPKSLPVEISNNLKFSFSEKTVTPSAAPSTTPNAVPNLKNVGLEAEYETIISVLKQVNFNKTKAAQVLNIDRKTLYNKMKACNI